MSTPASLLCCLGALLLTTTTAWAQSADGEVLPPGSQSLPPIEGGALIDGATPADTPPVQGGADPTATGAVPTGTTATATPTPTPTPTPTTNGVIARLEADSSLKGPVVLTLADPDGNTAELILQDNGEAPDLEAGDGSWAGVVDNAPLQVTVRLAAPGRSLEAGPVEWQADQQPRDLDLKLEGDQLTATATVHQGQALGAGEQVPGGVPETQPTPSPQVATTATTSNPLLPAASSSSSTTSPVIWMALGALLAALFGAGLLWMRQRQATGVVDAPGLPPRLPEAGLLGPGTPALSDGLSVWSCHDPEAALEALLATVADGRQVVAVAPSAQTLPPVVGGPIYRAQSARPPAIAQAVQALRASSGAPVSVFLLADKAVAEHIDDIQDVLPDGVGGVVLTRTTGAVGKRPTVALARTDTGWTATVAGQSAIALQRTHRGLSPA